MSDLKKTILILIPLAFITVLGLLVYPQMGEKPSDNDGSLQNTPGINTYAVSSEAKKAEDAALIGNILERNENEESSKNYDIVKKEINQKLQSIMSIKSASSNAYTLIKDNKDFEYLVQQKDIGLKCMLDMFKESEENGLKEYIMAVACSRILGEDPTEQRWDTGRGWYEQYCAKEFVALSGSLKAIYTLALESMMPVDEGLNHDMKYIAIDCSKLRYISEPEKEQILKYFNSKYNIKTMDASYDKLKEMGMVNDASNSLEGILLNISKANVIDKKNVIIEGYKYKSGLGSVGVKSKVTCEDGNWKLESSGMTWIS